MNTFVIKSKDDLEKIVLTNPSGLKAEFLKNNSALFNLSYKDLSINLSQGHALEGNVQNIFLRVFEGDKIEYTPLTGPLAPAAAKFNDSNIIWQGEFKGIEYKLSFKQAKEDSAWFWSTDLKNNNSNDVTCDLIYLQDKGIAAAGAVKTNEFYTSHYIDIKVFEDKDINYVICARQNQGQSTGQPWMMEGCLEGAVAYSTDANQFFGIEYKETNTPKALISETLESVKIQGEYNATALQTEKMTIAADGTDAKTFFALFIPDHQEATDERALGLISGVKSSFEGLTLSEDNLENANKETSLINTLPLFKADELTSENIAKCFGDNLKHVEEVDGKLFSFFTEKTHVILKAKEVICERPQGHIVRSGKNLYPVDDMLCSTNYMYGCFNAQIAVGNTSFNQMMSHPRTMLNLLKSNGQRIIVDLEGEKFLLGIPSAYEVGFTSSRYIYKQGETVIVVKVWTDLEDQVVHTEISSTVPCTFTVYSELSLGPNEFDQRGTVTVEDNLVTMLPEEGSMVSGRYPNAKFFLTSDKENTAKIGGAELIYEGAITNLPCVVIESKKTDTLKITMGGCVTETAKTDALASKYKDDNKSEFKSDTDAAFNYFRGVLRNFNMEIADDKGEEVARLNDILTWYLHNALVHFSIPHGLEQYSGAAWGVRDVLQGSVEFLLAAGKGEVVKEILKTVFSHQFIENGDWPQWFMFDEYKYIQDDHSHGDIIVWPLKAVSEYIEYTNDFSVLDEKVPYTQGTDSEKSFTKETYTIMEHLEYVLKTIKESFIEGTSLPCYGGGDWDDTLQPANQDLKKRMISGWTAAIAFQYINKFADVCAKGNFAEVAEKAKQMANDIKADYRKLVIHNETVAGFLYVNQDNSIDYMLHPEDKKTGIKYRLLPMTRCMLAELFTKEEAQKHYDLIKENLRYPDGVRLMTKHAPYNGGTSSIFLRAERAAYCGREVGLQYVHAHLRYIEAMLKIGDADEAFKAAKQVNPISIVKEVPNADIRQSNAYFSSADIDFKDRYEAKEGDKAMREGTIKSKGGWRIYSSGPGIYMHQIMNNLVGLRTKFDDVLFDPVIPTHLDGLVSSFDFEGKALHMHYTTGGKNSCGVAEIKINGKVVEGTPIENPYRKAGIAINKDTFAAALTEATNKIEIVLG